MRPRFIAIEGPIGVGKTTLAKDLAAALDARFVPDPDDANPYLEPFYRDPSAYALHVQLHFLLARLEAMERVSAMPPSITLVSDFLIEKDPLFAELTLDGDEWSIYRRLHERLIGELPRPDLVIYLQAPLERLVERIERRGVEHERRIDSRYLEALAAAYERFFHAWNASTLLIVNTAGIDIASEPAETRRLLERIADIDGGRHYFNPALPAR